MRDSICARHARAAAMAVVACLGLLAGCSTVSDVFDPSLEGKIMRANKFHLIEDDGQVAIWSVREFPKGTSKAWGELVRDERRRAQDFLAESVHGKVAVRLINAFPSSYDGDGLSTKDQVFIRLLPDAQPKAEVGDIIAHELTHIVLSGSFGPERPYWLEEGVAAYVEGQRLGFEAGRKPALAECDQLDRVVADGASLDRLSTYPKHLQYRLAAAAVQLIEEKHGRPALRRVLHEVRAKNFDDVYFRVTGERRESLDARWRAAIRQASRPASLIP